MKCRNCGNEYSGTARQCPECGILVQPFKTLHKPKTVHRYSPIGWFISSLSAIAAVVAVAFLVAKIAPGLLSGSDGEQVEDERYTELFSDFEQNLQAGSASNYQALIEARRQLEEIKELPVATVDTALFIHEEDLNNRLVDAYSGWINAAKAQYEIAESVADALKYYNRADSILPDQRRTKNEMQTMASQSELKGAQLLVSSVTYDGVNMEITYKYYGKTNGAIALTVEDETGNETQVNMPVFVDRERSYSFKPSAPVRSEIIIKENGTPLYRKIIQRI